MAIPLCPCCNCKMKFAFKLPSKKKEVIRRYRCPICDAESTTFPRMAEQENKEIRRGMKEASGKAIISNARLSFN